MNGWIIWFVSKNYRRIFYCVFAVSISISKNIENGSPFKKWMKELLIVGAIAWSAETLVQANPEWPDGFEVIVSALIGLNSDKFINKFGGGA